MSNEDFIRELERTIKETPNPRDKLTLKWMAWIIVFLKSSWSTKLEFIKDRKEIAATLEVLRKDISELRRAARTTSYQRTTRANKGSIGRILPESVEEGREGRREIRRRER